MNQQQRRAEASVMLQTVAGFAQVVPQTDPEYRVSIVPAFKKFLTAYGVKADDVLIKLSAEEQMMMQMQQQMAAAQQSAQTGPAADSGAASPPPPSGAGAAPSFGGVA